MTLDLRIIKKSMYGGPKPCKFGADCRNFAQGNCRFFHDPNTRPNISQPPPTGGTQDLMDLLVDQILDQKTRVPILSQTQTQTLESTIKHNKNDNADVSNQLCRIFHLGS